MRRKQQSVRHSLDAAAPATANQADGEAGSMRLAQAAAGNPEADDHDDGAGTGSKLVQEFEARYTSDGNIHLNLLYLVLELYKIGPLDDGKAVLTRVLDWLDETLKRTA